MTYLKKFIFTASLAVAAFGFSLSSHATLISHDVLFEGSVVGEITVHLFENGTIGEQELIEFKSFSFFGENVTDTLSFLAVVDTDDVFAGIEYLDFDVDVAGLNIGIFGIYDVFALDPAIDNFFEIFDIKTVPTTFFTEGELSLGAATVVSEPSVFVMFVLALLGFGMRHRAK